MRRVFAYLFSYAITLRTHFLISFVSKINMKRKRKKNQKRKEEKKTELINTSNSKLIKLTATILLIAKKLHQTH